MNIEDNFLSVILWFESLSFNPNHLLRASSYILLSDNYEHREINHGECNGISFKPN